VGPTAIWISIAAALLGCYFAAVNIALKAYSQRRLTELLELRAKSDRVEPFVQRVPGLLLITGTLRAILSMAVLLFTLKAVQEQATGWDAWGQYLLSFGIALVVVTVMHVGIPSSWGRHHREGLVAVSMPLLTVLHQVLTPAVRLLQLLDPPIRRITGADLREEDDHEAIGDDVISMVEQRDKMGAVDDQQKQMIEAIFEFPATTAGEIMTPRTEVQGIELGSSLTEVKELILNYGHSRLPVYDDSLDNISGLLYAKDLIRYLGDGQAFSLKSSLRPAHMVPETKPVHELLAEFKARKVHIAIVLDEYGGTAGLVTIEDILEELVGEIQDEYELTEEPPSVVRIDDTTARVDARMHIDDLNDELSVDLPEDEDYDTIGGFVFSTLGHIPEVGEHFEHENLRITVAAAEKTRINQVTIEKLAASSSTTNAG